MAIFKKLTLTCLIASLVCAPLTNAQATSISARSVNLPNIGTAAAGTLSIEKEIEFGHAYMRTLRASQPMINDPLLEEYVNELGAQLIANASDVKTPFHFFLIQNRTINAFAFFGGYIGLHSGLFLYAQNESEFASVIAHEIAHLTQRHLARAMEAQAKQNPIAMAALVGSLLLAVAAPQAGIAAAQATTAASLQSQINYTRNNEQEADRLGIETLSQAGFDVYAMPAFFNRVADQYRFSSKPPQFLITHPLPDSRITDSRARAQQYPQKTVPSSPSYELARARIIARFAGLDSKGALDWFARKLKHASPAEKIALNYGKALVYMDSRKFKQAEQLLRPLYKNQPNNAFFLDAMTDLNLGQQRYSEAIKRLDDALKIQPDNRTLLLNRDYARIKAKQYASAIDDLLRYTHRYPQDITGWSLLFEAYQNQRIEHGALAAQAEMLALQAQWDQAINQYTQASQLVKLGSQDQARYDARIDQLREQKLRFQALAQ